MLNNFRDDFHRDILVLEAYNSGTQKTVTNNFPEALAWAEGHNQSSQWSRSHEHPVTKVEPQTTMQDL